MDDSSSNAMIEFYRQLHASTLGRYGQSQKEELYSLCSRLPLTAGRQLAIDALNLIDDQPAMAEEILDMLACFVDGALTEVHGRLLDRNDYFRPFLYRGADPAYADPLIDELIRFDEWSNTQRSVNEALLILACIGGERVERQFRAWRETPPVWQRKPFLFVSPAAYSQEAGWELTSEGKRRDLFFHTSYRLVASDAPDDSSAVKVLHKLDEACPACQQPLFALFDFDLASPKLKFLELEGERLVIKTCLNCTCTNTVFMDVDWAGRASWSPDNQISPNDLPSWNFPEYRLHIGTERRTPFESMAGHGSVSSPSQIGGHPMWWQDAEYPTCPKCHRLMMCIAQVEDGDLMGSPGEGALYTFLCAACGKSATVVQST